MVCGGGLGQVLRGQESRAKLPLPWKKSRFTSKRSSVYINQAIMEYRLRKLVMCQFSGIVPFLRTYKEELTKA